MNVSSKLPGSMLVSWTCAAMQHLLFLYIISISCEGVQSRQHSTCYWNDQNVQISNTLCPSGQYRPDTNQSGCQPCFTLLAVFSFIILWVGYRFFSHEDLSEMEVTCVGGCIIMILIVFLPCYACAPCCSYCEPGRFSDYSDLEYKLTDGDGYFFQGNTYRESQDSSILYSLDCEYCPPGKFTAGFGQTACQSCQAGYFTANAGAQYLWSCQACSPGFISWSAASSTCTACPPGLFTSSTASQSCSPCPPGSIAALQAASSCSSCPMGTFAESAGSSECTNCEAGTFSSTVGSSSALACIFCSPGTYSTTEAVSACTLCFAGTFSSVPGLTTNACNQCDAGSFAAFGSSACWLCMPGYYSNSTGSNSCVACGMGTYSSDAGATTPCVPCDPGTYSMTAASTCQVCTEGYYAADSGSSVCTPCSAGAYQSATANDTCQSCPEGFFSSSGSSSCKLCVAGTFSLAGSGFCNLCDVGKYSDKVGANSSETCQSCPTGMFSNVARDKCIHFIEVFLPISAFAFVVISIVAFKKLRKRMGTIASEKIAKAVAPQGLRYAVPPTLILGRQIEKLMPLFDPAPGPYPKFTLANGTLPLGIKLNRNSGEIYGVVQARPGQIPANNSASVERYVITIDASNIKGSCSCQVELVVETRSAPTNLSFEVGSQNLVNGVAAKLNPSLRLGLPTTSFKVLSVANPYADELQSLFDDVKKVTVKEKLLLCCKIFKVAQESLASFNDWILDAERCRENAVEMDSVSEDLLSLNVGELEKQLMSLKGQEKEAASKGDYASAALLKDSHDTAAKKLEVYKSHLGLMKRLFTGFTSVRTGSEALKRRFDGPDTIIVEDFSKEVKQFGDRCEKLLKAQEKASTLADSELGFLRNRELSALNTEACSAKNLLASKSASIENSREKFLQFWSLQASKSLQVIVANVEVFKPLIREGQMREMHPLQLQYLARNLDFGFLRNACVCLSDYVQKGTTMLELLVREHNDALSASMEGNNRIIAILLSASALPDGLTIDIRNGVITGSPTRSTERWACKVVAFNESGECSTTLLLTISDQTIPSDLEYPSQSEGNINGVLVVGERVTIAARCSFGLPAGRFKVNPPLPPGISLDIVSGTISGCPQQAIKLSTYDIRLQNIAGLCEFKLDLEVQHHVLPVSFRYSEVAENVNMYHRIFVCGEDIDPCAPEFEIMGSHLLFTSEPALPAGFKLDQSTGMISGVPLFACEKKVYSVIASNRLGSKSCTITFSVAPPFDRVDLQSWTSDQVQLFLKRKMKLEDVYIRFFVSYDGMKLRALESTTMENVPKDLEGLPDFVLIALRLQLGGLKPRVVRPTYTHRGDRAEQSMLPVEIQEHYVAEKIIGTGSSAVVVRASRTDIKKAPVAIKVIYANQQSGTFSTEETRRLDREATILRRIKSPYIVKLLDNGRSDEICWLIMEHLDGSDMEKVLQDEGPVGAAESIKLGRNVLAAITVLHGFGIVHRDIKPANIVRCQDEQANKGTRFASNEYKLVDFGIAVGIDEKKANQTMMTQWGLTEVGTLPYMSPEIFRDPLKVSYPTDLWSLGVTLFQLVTKELPFVAESDLMWSNAIAGDKEAPSVLEKMSDKSRPTFNRDLADVIARSLQKNVKNRFHCAEEMNEALFRCLVKEGEEQYSVFISYRVLSEAPFARLLFDELNNTVTPGGHRVAVFWDAFRLVKARDWEEGFCNALANSLCIFPLLSYGATAPLAMLPDDPAQRKKIIDAGWDERPLNRDRLRGTNDDKEDNVLKELLISSVLIDLNSGTNQMTHHCLQSAYPILIGRPHPMGHQSYPAMGDFFLVCGGGGKFANTPSTATNNSVSTFLRDKAKVPSSVLKQAERKSTAEVLQYFFKLQGCQMYTKAKLSLSDDVVLTEQQRSYIGQGYVGPAVDLDGRKLTPEECTKGFDEKQLCILKQLIQEKIGDFHEVIDRAVHLQKERKKVITAINANIDSVHPFEVQHRKHET